MTRAVQQAALLDDIGNEGRERLSREAFTSGFIGNGARFGIDANYITVLDCVHRFRAFQNGKPRID